ncbi:MAG: substrate-binding domain-containing protein [Lachnospiraceae bacterium]|jgi:inositol transport system substrate-binding protein|nr:substrate-binding domain-containing protein [Lachnospiraceae bacterium]
MKNRKTTKNRMKTLSIAVTLLFLVSVFLNGCGKGQTKFSSAAPGQTDVPKTADAAKEPQNSTPMGDGYSITFVLNNRDEFTNTLADGMQAKANELKVELSMQDAANDTGKLIQFVETAKNAGEDAVVVFPIDSETIPTIIEAAGDMPVVFVNRAPDDLGYLTGKSAYVGSEEWEAGYFQGEYLTEYFKERDIDVVKPIMLLGPIGAENTTKRTESVKQAMIDGGLTVEVVVELGCQWDRETAITKISPLLNTADYNCIIANGDTMACGAVEALISANLDPAEIPIVGINADNDARACVKSGAMKMTVFQDAAGQGSGALSVAVNMIQGKELSDGTGYEADTKYSNVIWVPFEPVTIDNVQDYE